MIDLLKHKDFASHKYDKIEALGHLPKPLLLAYSKR